MKRLKSRSAKFSRRKILAPSSHPNSRSRMSAFAHRSIRRSGEAIPSTLSESLPGHFPRRRSSMKAKKVVPIPKGYHAVTPYLSVKGASDAIEFYKKAFAAKEVMRMPGPNGTVGHAEIEIDKCRIMLADEYPDMNFRSPQAFGGTSVHIHLYVKNADEVADRAVAAGAKMLRPVLDQFYGDRSGSVEDPFGHVWHVATHTKDVSMSELKKRAVAMAAAAEKS